MNKDTFIKDGAYIICRHPAHHKINMSIYAVIINPDETQKTAYIDKYTYQGKREHGFQEMSFEKILRFYKPMTEDEIKIFKANRIKYTNEEAVKYVDRLYSYISEAYNDATMAYMDHEYAIAERKDANETVTDEEMSELSSLHSVYNQWKHIYINKKCGNYDDILKEMVTEKHLRYCCLADYISCWLYDAKSPAEKIDIEDEFYEDTGIKFSQYIDECKYRIINLKRELDKIIDNDPIYDKESIYDEDRYYEDIYYYSEDSVFFEYDSTCPF